MGRCVRYPNSSVVVGGRPTESPPVIFIRAEPLGLSVHSGTPFWRTWVESTGGAAGGGNAFEPSWNTGYGTSIDATWESTVHDGKGVIGLTDGSVSMMKSPQFRDQISVILAAGATNVSLSKPQGTF